MKLFQLRTHRLRTEEVAITYLPHWLLHIESLKLFGVETHAFSQSLNPRIVLALINFAQGADLEIGYARLHAERCIQARHDRLRRSAD